MPQPYLIYNNRTEPHWNLAVEEYLLTATQDEVFMLWRNGPSIIVGRNQNTLAEIDTAFCAAHNIPVVRRLTGGGAVFHDLGNVNYTYIATEDGPIDFARFAQPVVEALRAWGLPAELSGRNDILLGEQKISGNAQTMRHGRVLHHGTLLYNADLKSLAGALRARPDKYKGRGVASVAARVGNIASHLDAAPSVEDFLTYLYGYLSEYLDAIPRELFPEEAAAIDSLTAEKYGTREWNYGHMGDYAFHGSCRVPSGGLDVLLNINGGHITEARFCGDFFGKREVSELAGALIGLAHSYEAVEAFLSRQPLGDYFWGFDRKDVLSAMF